MPFFPSIKRPVEGVPNIPGAVNAGAVSMVQLLDQDRQVMRTVAIVGGTDGAVHVVGGDLRAQAPIGDNALLAAVLVDSEAVCGECAPSAKPSALAVSMGPRPWRVQSMVAYRSGFQDCTVVVARIPTTPPQGEYRSEILVFHTRPLDSLAVPTDALSTRFSTLVSTLQRAKEHIMRLFSVHVEPSATGRRIHSGIVGGSILHSNFEPPGHTIICSSYEQGKSEETQVASFYGLQFPRGGQRGKVSPEIIAFNGDERFHDNATTGCFMPIWPAIAAEIETKVLHPASTLAITSTSTPEPQSSLGAVSWMVSVGCLDGTIILARSEKAIVTIQTLGRCIGPCAWLQFFSNRSITRDASSRGSEETRSARLDKLLTVVESQAVDFGGASSPLLATPATFSSQLCLLALDVAGRALQWAHISTAPVASQILDAEEADPQVDEHLESHVAPDAEAGDKRESKSLPKKDKSIVGRWLTRGKAFQSQGGVASSSQADLTSLVDEAGSHSRFSDHARAHASSVRDLRHIHSNSARLSAVSSRDGQGVGTVLGRGPVAAAFVDHCFDDDLPNRGPQLLISTLGRVIAFCVQPHSPVDTAPSAEAGATPAKPSGSHDQAMSSSVVSLGKAPGHSSSIAVIDYLDVMSPMTFLGLADFSGVGDSVLLMAGAELVAVMPLHERPANAVLLERLQWVKEVLSM